MFKSILEKFKLLQFRYITGLQTNSNITFVDETYITRNLKQSSDLSTEIDMEAIKTLGNTSKETFLYSNPIAKAMCQFMALAYEDDHTIENVLKFINGRVVYKNEGTNILYFEDANLLVLSFAGTKVESLKDWWTNITGTYQQEWNKQRLQIIQMLNKYKTSNVIVCGHSKGGVLSIIAYNDLALDIDACYVAGVPDYFVNSKNAIGIYSIKDRRDPISNILGSYKSNWEVIIGNDGEYSIESHRILSYIKTLTIKN